MPKKRQKIDGRSKTSAENGRKGGHPVGPVGPQLRTRERAKAIQRHAELTAETVVEQIARGALFDVGRLFYAKAGFELYESDGPEVRSTVMRDGQAIEILAPAWRKGEVKRRWEAGDVRPLNDLTEEERSCIAGVEVVLKNAEAGDGITDRILKYKLEPRSKYVEMAAKYHSLLVEKVDVSVTDVGSKLDAARQAALERNRKKGKP